MPALPEGIEATGDTLEVRALTAWVEEHSSGETEYARQIAERALMIARVLNDQRGISESSVILGRLVSDLRLKEVHYLAAQEAFERLRDNQGLNRNRVDLGNVYDWQGEIEKALTVYFDALEGFERIGDREGQARVLNNIGLVYERHGEVESGIRYYEQAVMLTETLSEPALLANNLNSYGAALASVGLYMDAEVQLRRALSISQDQGGYHLRTVVISNNLGYLFNEQGQYEEALPFLLDAESISKELGVSGPLFAVYDELGKAYLGLGQYEEALHYSHEALVLVQEAGSFSQKMSVYQTLSWIYEALGNDRQALVHFQHYATARDSVFNAEKAEVTAEMQTRYETEAQKRVNERLRQENRIQALQLVLLLSVVVAAFLVAGLFYYRYRAKWKASQLLEELDAVKSRFFANISHEFRTPLTVILGGLQDGLTGRFGVVSEQLAKRDQALLHNAHQLQRLVDEVLKLNSLDAGRLVLKSTPGDLVLTLQQLVNATTPLAERNGITLTFESSAEHCYRSYDEEKLEKIVGNLLANALKFTPSDGLVCVTLYCGKSVEITVTDNGPGIPIEAQKHVFERFMQVQDGFYHGGTGIGLALAKELAELYGGTITLRSEPGEGCVFTVRLPLERVALNDVLEASVSPSLHILKPGQSLLNGADTTPFGGFEVGGDGAAISSDERHVESDQTTVLIIEDNADVRAFVRRSLEVKYRVLESRNGEAGLQQVYTELPDLVVSDVMLPGIDGYEVARRLKSKSETECIPLVMLTARVTEEDQAEGYVSGAEVYITKPFSSDTLHAAIARLLEERQRLQRRLREEAENATLKYKGERRHTAFGTRIKVVVLEHLHDEGFGVKELASVLNMTRQTLYNRFKSDIGLSPSDFIRTHRLERAQELLFEGAGLVSEIGYAVGFSSLSAFSRAYRAHFGQAPSEHLCSREEQWR